MLNFENVLTLLTCMDCLSYHLTDKALKLDCVMMNYLFWHGFHLGNVQRRSSRLANNDWKRMNQTEKHKFWLFPVVAHVFRLFKRLHLTFSDCVKDRQRATQAVWANVRMIIMQPLAWTADEWAGGERPS